MKSGWRRQLGQIMIEQKYAVDLVYDGNDGLAYALSGQYDAVVLDVMLPGRSGFDVVREMRLRRMPRLCCCLRPGRNRR